MKWFKRLLKDIENANRKNYGSERMDCCDINQKDKPMVKPSEKHNDKQSQDSSNTD